MEPVGCSKITAGTIYMLADSPLSSWTPERGTTGLYRAQEATANAACLRFTAQSYTIIDVLVETPLIAEEPVVEDSVVVDVEQAEEKTIPEWAPQAVTVLTVSALLSCLPSLLSTMKPFASRPP